MDRRIAAGGIIHDNCGKMVLVYAGCRCMGTNNEAVSVGPSLGKASKR